MGSVTLRSLSYAPLRDTVEVVIDLQAATAGTGLEVTAGVTDGVLAATFSGSAEMQAFEAMQHVVGALHRAALEQRVSLVSVDFIKLEFMSSSCFKCLVTWISDITELSAEVQYKVRFLSSTEQLWQRRSLHVLQTFATDLVSIET